jgi:hypothetical protein
MDFNPETPPDGPALRILSVRYRSSRADLCFYRNGAIQRYLTLKSQSLRSFFKKPYKSLWMDRFTPHEEKPVMQEQMRDDLIEMMKSYQASLPERPKRTVKTPQSLGKEVSHQTVSGRIMFYGKYPARKSSQLDVLDGEDNLEKSFVGGNLEQEIARTNVVEGDYITVQMTAVTSTSEQNRDDPPPNKAGQHIFYEIEKEIASCTANTSYSAA